MRLEEDAEESELETVTMPSSVVHRQRLRDLEQGETAYTYEYAIKVDRSNRGWLDTEYPAYPVQGDRRLEVTKGQEGWVVKLYAPYEWDARSDARGEPIRELQLVYAWWKRKRRA